jgi:hypothetical protein
MYLSDPVAYASTAKFWTECYAQPKVEGAGDVSKISIIKIVLL